jgi:hypothetical protein
VVELRKQIEKEKKSHKEKKRELESDREEKLVRLRGRSGIVKEKIVMGEVMEISNSISRVFVSFSTISLNNLSLSLS